MYVPIYVFRYFFLEHARVLGLCFFVSVCVCVSVCVLQVGPHKIFPIFYCNEGGHGENILRNIVGNNGGLGGGY